MSSHDFPFHGTTLTARPSGALWWAEARILTVSDLHFGKSDRHARRSGIMLPPYEIAETLARLEADIAATNPASVICLGDSFDDLAARDAFTPDHLARLTPLMAGRTWIWIEGNHDPGPLDLGGQHKAEYRAGPLSFRHIATADKGEISGHYHPKAAIRTRARTVTRACFLVDAHRVILPAYGTYTGGLRTDDLTLSRLMAPDAQAILTGPSARAFPMPRYLDA
ncbi:ligase-associated DNA damage response endonuclease PdeM [Pseudaestuariivita atlantica]|uniref:Metallophosphoesterase n=1 Tax=Pseudaestuariivita atlantica TaxID=1317121 RepID=A0A0L1JSR3_9RHOB|nr:ligase-associated DNA damage response endonuclease PdeM [Pseudaestuariivita atlantica]KNG94795.1 metallophosphoesterase [Pseudaestuariivita atlantica]